MNDFGIWRVYCTKLNISFKCTTMDNIRLWCSEIIERGGWPEVTRWQE